MIPANNNELEEDVVVPFMLDAFGIHGKCVSLTEVVDQILSGHKYPEVVAQLLGELLVLTTMIGSLLKLKGNLTVQLKGDGKVSFLTADYTKGGTIRGYAHIVDEEAILSIKTSDRKSQDIGKIFGKGFVVVTIEEPNVKPYQAIVPLEGSSLSDCILGYFKESNQVNCVIESVCQKTEGKWRARGVLIQKLAIEGGKKTDIAPQKTKEERQDDWDTTKVLLSSITDDELLDKSLTPHDLLYRLFHEFGIRAFDPVKLVYQCRCSREKMEKGILSIPIADLEDLAKENIITMKCHFCNREEIFKLEELIEKK